MGNTSCAFGEALLGIPGAQITGFQEKACILEIQIELPQKAHPCPRCGQWTSLIHDYRRQPVRDLPIRGKRVSLLYKKRRYRCDCGKRFFESTSFLERYQRITRRAYRAMMDALRETVSFSSVARRYGLSVSTIMRLFDQIAYERDFEALPRVLSIDEFKGNTGGERYNVILTDPENRTVLDILPMRYARSLASYFSQASVAARKQVQFFVSDMWTPYVSTAGRFFPKATTVVDKYHWVRQVIWAFEKVRKDEQKALSGKQRVALKKSRQLLLKRYAGLTEPECKRADEMLRLCPRLAVAHELKEQFQQIFLQKSSAEATARLSKWVEMAEVSELRSFAECAKTFRKWEPGILNSLRHPYTNGFTEGCNNKIKVLKRNAFGFRNFQRFRKRVLHIFSGAEEAQTLAA